MVVRISVCWSRVLSQLEVTKELESTMTDEHKDLQQRTLCILRGKLEVATQKVSKFSGNARLSVANRLKFVVLKDTLEETITELEAWQKLYQPSWFHLIKLAPPTIDMTLNNVTLNNVAITGPQAAAEPSSIARNLRKSFREPSGNAQSVFIREEELDSCAKKVIPFCTAMVATRPKGGGRLIVDTAIKGAVQSRDARDFARRLRYSDPSVFGLLNCKGVVRLAKTSGTAFLFRVPEEYTSIRSVRQLLLSGEAHNSLSDRLEMAKQLASAVYYVHLYGFVHKNIRPETILSLGKTGEGELPRTAFLVGFQVIRNADGRTYPVVDVNWETNLYRHPLRQGINVDYYVMQHDIYSLGVCLLEIGLWESFVAYGADGVARPSKALGLGKGRAELQQPSALKEHLVALGRSSTLRAKMGTKYSKIVETCLTCLDEDNLDFGDEEEFEDEDGVAVGVRYIEKVLGILNDISI